MDDIIAIAISQIFVLLIYVMEIAFNVAIGVFIIKAIRNTIKRKTNHTYFKNNVIVESKRTDPYVDISKSKLAQFHIDDLDELKEYLYNIFLDFENAYSNLDYNTMKILSTKQLYHNYYTGLSLNLKVGKKRIFNNIEKNKMIIFEMDSTIAKQTVSAMIEISYINYVIDKNGYIISGNKEQKITERFEVIFRKDFEKDEITKCPNCGATVTGNKCDYCRSTIKNVEFKISSIKKIVDQ